jgi:ribosome-associated translation inhibitor RaiA
VAAALRRLHDVMEEPLKLTFHGVEPTPAIEDRIRDRFAKLEQLSDGIVACHVTVEAPHRHHHKGTLFNVRIDLTVKHGEIVVGRDAAHDHAHEDLYVAIRDSFDVARRLLQDYVRKQRGDVKHREPASI